MTELLNGTATAFRRTMGPFFNTSWHVRSLWNFHLGTLLANSNYPALTEDDAPCSDKSHMLTPTLSPAAILYPPPVPGNILA